MANTRIQVYNISHVKIKLLYWGSKFLNMSLESRGPCSTADISIISINLIVDNVDTSVTVNECNKHVYIKQLKDIIKNKKCVVLFICSI